MVHHILNHLQSWVLDEEPSIEIMKAAWDLGVNTIDTANMNVIERYSSTAY